jgi:MAE_28990/MAE_18760-like HEPN
MKIPTSAALGTRLDRNLAWRKKELTQMKFVADSAVPANAGLLRRAGIALMYAHWEGFVKDASIYYLTYLASVPLEVGKLKSCLVAVALSGDIRASGKATRISVRARVVDLFRSLEQPPPAPPVMRRMPVKRVIATRSNLKGEVLREIAATIGIDYSAFALKEKPVIDRLVQLRNKIAHGIGVPVAQADYVSLHNEIIALMDHYRTLIQDAADNDRHLR